MTTPIGRVMVTITATSMEDAKSIGRLLTNFTLDESQDPLKFLSDRWIIFGTAVGGEVKNGDESVTVEPDREMTTQEDN